MADFFFCKNDQGANGKRLTKKGRAKCTADVSEARNGEKAQSKTMSIILYLGRTVKEYGEISAGRIGRLLSEGSLLCKQCLQPMRRHSSYVRGIKETGQEIEITVVWCGKCKEWHALLPDFLLPGKHYSGNEIESVIIDSATEPVSQIETEASESTVRRWVNQIGEKIKQAVGILKVLFGRLGRAVSEAAIDAGPAYSELEQILGMAPASAKHTNKLGLANIWLGTNKVAARI